MSLGLKIVPAAIVIHLDFYLQLFIFNVHVTHTLTKMFFVNLSKVNKWKKKIYYI